MESFQFGGLLLAQRAPLVGAPLAAQPGAQRQPRRRDVLDGHLQIPVLQIILEGGGVVFLPLCSPRIPHHADGFQPGDARRGHFAVGAALAVIGEPLAEGEALRVVIEDIG